MKNIISKIGIFSVSLLFGYALLVPPFDPPDEQSHLAQMHFFVNRGRMPNLLDQENLSVEGAYVEHIIGTMPGENNYLFHPEYKFEMSSTSEGIYENDLQNYNNDEAKSTYELKQSSTYPPLYYWVTGALYKTLYNNDFFTRLFSLRLLTALFTAGIPVIAYLIGKLVLEDEKKALVLASMVLLFPMTTYLGVGINSDNLHFLLFSSVIFLYLKLIKDGWFRDRSLTIGTLIGLDLITKPQAYILLPIGVLAVVIRWKWSEWKVWLKNVLYMLIPVLLIAGWQEIPKLIGGNDSVAATAYVARVINYGGLDNFRTYFSRYITTHFKEIIVWYWGVFKWLGIILPRPFWWTANRLILISGIGIMLTFIKDIKKRKLSWESKVIIFSIFANAIYIASIFWFDWQFFQEYGRSLGLQARYYYPLLSTQMLLLYMGLLNLTKNKKIQDIISKFLILYFLSLHLAGLYSLLASYYQLSPLSVFFTQLSQYRPWFAKGNWWYQWVAFYIFGLLGTLKLGLGKDE